MQQRHTNYALLIETGAHAGMVLPLTGDLFSIGRELDNTLVLDSPRLSRYHARLRVSPAGTVLLEDLGSTNGTFIEGFLISGTRRLAVGEAFTLAGTVRLRLIEDADAREFTPPPQWTVPATEPVRFPLAGSVAPPTESETWIAPALAPAMQPTPAQTTASHAGSLRKPVGLYFIIGLLVLAICAALALGIYLHFAPASVYQQITTILGLPTPPP